MKDLPAARLEKSGQGIADASAAHHLLPNGGAPTSLQAEGRKSSRESASEAALQVICLGGSGGPSEENITAFLVRSLASEWTKGSLLAVDAGSHLAPITRIVERDFALSREKVERERPKNGVQTPGLSKNLARTSLSPAEVESSSEDEEDHKPEPTVITEGPFTGLRVPHATGRANALHILQTYISTYLITHPHMDHMAGFTINTAAFHATSKPKTLAALPSTVDAMKRHVFNDIIWPNLTDEDGGVGFVTFQRLKEGGDPMLGEGEGRGYIDVCDGLGAKAFKVSHGVCTKSPPSHQHRGSITSLSDPHNSIPASEPAPAMARSMSMATSQYSAPGTPGPTPRQSFYSSQPQTSNSPRMAPQENTCVVDSTAYFIRDLETARELLFFGDVEPDSISLHPRNQYIWAEAARKLAHGKLRGIFIECSYDDSQPDAYLFGHLCPRHLIAEMANLAMMTAQAKAQRAAEVQERRNAKRKRSDGRGPNGLGVREGNEKKRSRSLASRTVDRNLRRRSEQDYNYSDSGGYGFYTGPSSPDSTGATTPEPPSFVSQGNGNGNGNGPSQPQDTPMSPHTTNPVPATGEQPHSHFDRSVTSNGIGSWEPPLKDLRVGVIHIKDTYRDGPHVSETILAQLREHAARLAAEGHELGCEFFIGESGGEYRF